MRDILIFGCGIVFLLSGCQAPPAPMQVQKPLPPQGVDAARGNETEGENWLSRALRGGNSGASHTPASSDPFSAPVSPAVAPGTGSVVPASNPAVYSGQGVSGKTVVPAVAIEPLPEKEGEIPMSRVGPPAAIITPPPLPPSDPSSTPSKRSEKKGEEQDFWSSLAPENIYKNIKNASGYGPNEESARQAFKEGQELFRQKKYSEAAGKFGTAAERWPDTPLEEDALFNQAESYFFADRYPKAHDAYLKLFKKYSNSRYLDRAVGREFAIGRYWEQLNDAHPLWVIQPNLTDNSRPLFDTFGNAMAAYQNVRLYDPLGPLADDSVMASAVAQFRRNRFEEAAEDFEQLRKDYPNSEHQIYAHILGLQAEMREYQGTLYDQTALNKAYETANATLTQFGPKLGPEQARVAKARALILEEKANRIFAVGKYYEKNKYYGSARICYQNLIAEYPSTAKVREARERLEAIKDFPDNPPNHFQWLSDLLPASKKK